MGMQQPTKSRFLDKKENSYVSFTSRPASQVHEDHMTLESKNFDGCFLDENDGQQQRE